jgi:NitT/TauT family transport system substrate-binding protein
MFLVTAYGVMSSPVSAETIKIGLLRSPGSGAVYVAKEKGYFDAEGLTPELINFDSGQPIAVAAVSGDVDFGVTALTGGFYNLAGQGALRVIGGANREAPTFQTNAYLVSNRAYAAGLKSFKDLPGHSAAVSQIGSSPHYNLALLADKYGFDLKSIRIQPLQSITNMATAMVGGNTDFMIILVTAALPLVQRGDAKLLGWVGDETPWQLGGMFTPTRTANERRDVVERFLRAYRKGAREYYEAFVGKDGRREDGPTASEVLGILAKYIEQPVERVKLGIPYIDPEARLDVDDILRQIQWFKSQNMVRLQGDGSDMIDRRYVVPRP